jgi:hypothetical protein
MPESDQEVFDHFQTGYGDTEQVALMAYARYAKVKYDWVNHELSRLQRRPTPEEEKQWIAGQPNSRFDEIRDGAVSQFQASAEEFIRPRIEAERARALETAIISRVDAAAGRVERATSFRHRFFPDLFLAMLASFLLAVLLVIAALAIRGDPIIALLREVLAQPPPPPGH